MTEFNFVPYQTTQAGRVIDLWNSTLLKNHFPLLEQLWRQQTEGDPDFETQDVILAFAPDDTLAGFVLVKPFRGKTISPELMPKFAAYAEAGYIGAIVVAEQYQRQGLGRNLMQQAEKQLRQPGVKQIVVGASVRHFFPGPPIELPGLDAFFGSLGYQSTDRIETDLRRQLNNWSPPPLPEAVVNGGYSFAQGQAGEEQAILDFMWRTFPGRWLYEVQLFFKNGGLPQDITLLKDPSGTIEGFLMTYHRNSKVIGPSIYWNTLLEPAFGGIGPLGVSKNVRGLGLGLHIVVAGVNYLHGLGVTDCAIDWTTLVDFYGKLGFQPWKQYHRTLKEVL
jgi:GNAT superfamily N-acetyltransferase